MLLLRRGVGRGSWAMALAALGWFATGAQAERQTLEGRSITIPIRVTASLPQAHLTGSLRATPMNNAGETIELTLSVPAGAARATLSETDLLLNGQPIAIVPGTAVRSADGREWRFELRVMDIVELTGFHHGAQAIELQTVVGAGHRYSASGRIPDLLHLVKRPMAAPARASADPSAELLEAVPFPLIVTYGTPEPMEVMTWAAPPVP